MAAIDLLLRDLDGIAVETQPQRVRRRSRDFYWYSPILKRQLDHVTADAVVTPRDEAGPKPYGDSWLTEKRSAAGCQGMVTPVLAVALPISEPAALPAAMKSIPP